MGPTDPIVYVLDTGLLVESISVLPTVGNVDIVYDLTCDAQENIYLAGFVEGDIHLFSDTAYYNGGPTDGMIAKLGISGSVVSIEKESLISDIDLKAWPNPTTSQLTISHAEVNDGGLIKVYDMLGKCRLNKAIAAGSEQTEIDLSDFSPGLYLIHIESQEYSGSLKVVLQ